MIEKFLLFCQERNLRVYASSKENKAADAESRKIIDNLEWSLNEGINRKITKVF